MTSKNLKTVLALIVSCLLCIEVVRAQDLGAPLELERRQARAEMTVTSARLLDDGVVITAEGIMGVYGRVYVTYELKASDNSKTHGSVHGNGRGCMSDGAFATGIFSGYFHREGSVFTMPNIVLLGDGTQNFDVISFDAAAKTLTVDAYILK